MKPFDYDNAFEEETTETVVETIDDSIDAEWDKITAAHADSEEAKQREADQENIEGPQPNNREMFHNFYEKQRIRRRERIGVDAVRYGLLAVGLGTLCYFMIRYGISWLAWVLGIGAAVCAVVSAYGAGMYHEM